MPRHHIEWKPSLALVALPRKSRVMEAQMALRIMRPRTDYKTNKNTKTYENLAVSRVFHVFVRILVLEVYCGVHFGVLS